MTTKAQDRLKHLINGNGYGVLTKGEITELASLADVALITLEAYEELEETVRSVVSWPEFGREAFSTRLPDAKIQECLTDALAILDEETEG